MFSGLDTASNIAYRVSSGYRGGSFAASPFQLGQVKAMHVVLHVYPVTRDLGTALIVCEAVVAAELRDDRIQVEEALTVYNLGRTRLAARRRAHGAARGFTAFNAQATMSDQGVDEAGGTAKLRGTFPPGPARRSSFAGSSPGRATRTSTSTWAFPRTSRSRA